MRARRARHGGHRAVGPSAPQLGRVQGLWSLMVSEDSSTRALESPLPTLTMDRRAVLVPRHYHGDVMYFLCAQVHGYPDGHPWSP